jgi:glycosyltransferase involved in cell wall biosynthesis
MAAFSPKATQRVTSAAGDVQPAGCTVSMFPPSQQQPYLQLLHAALERRGIDSTSVVARKKLTPLWAWRTRTQIQAVHLHWLEWLLGSPDDPMVKRFVTHHINAVLLVIGLGVLRCSGVRIVWTVHNLRPHEPRFPWLEARVARAVARLAHDVVVHSRYARERFGQSHRTNAGVHILAHPHYLGVYPSTSETREGARRLLGIPADAFTYLIFGHIRAYKQVPLAIRAFRNLDEPGLHLVVAGQAHPSQSAAVTEAIGGDARVTHHDRRVPDEAVAVYHRAADAVILSYRDVFSSGALLLALSFGLPVVVPARSTATEVAPAPASAPFEEGGLETALLAVREGDQAIRRECASAAARASSWDDMARRLAVVYQPAHHGDQVT